MWFESWLVDYDVASNWGNWAYGAGVGQDPRDRRFDPLGQGRRYDPDGDYARRWMPELEGVAAVAIHQARPGAVRLARPPEHRGVLAAGANAVETVQLRSAASVSVSAVGTPGNHSAFRDREAWHVECFVLGCSGASMNEKLTNGPEPFALERGGRCVLLFVERSGTAMEASMKALSCFESMAWPQGWGAYVVEAPDRPDLVGWFGIRQTPTLIVIRDRSILAIEHECSPEACARVLALTGGRDAELAYDVDGVFAPELRRSCRA